MKKAGSFILNWTKTLLKLRLETEMFLPIVPLNTAIYMTQRRPLILLETFTLLVRSFSFSSTLNSFTAESTVEGGRVYLGVAPKYDFYSVSDFTVSISKGAGTGTTTAGTGTTADGTTDGSTTDGGGSSANALFPCLLAVIALIALMF